MALSSQENVSKGFKITCIEFKKIESRRGFTAHSIVYTLANTMLIIVNELYNPGIIWFFYPLIAWR